MEMIRLDNDLQVSMPDFEPNNRDNHEIRRRQREWSPSEVDAVVRIIFCEILSFVVGGVILITVIGITYLWIRLNQELWKQQDREREQRDRSQDSRPEE